MSGVHAGGCLCGNVRYEVDREPTRVTICHCRFCQRSTGSGYLVEPIFERPALRVVKGEPSVYEHRSAGSGKLLHLHFCGKCGTKLYTSFERYQEVVGVAGGTFDDPDWFDRFGANARHIFVGEAQRGTVIPAGVNVFSEHAITLDGQPIAPRALDTPVMIGARDA